MITADALQKMMTEAFPGSPVPAVLFDARDPNPGGYLPGDVVTSFGGKRWVDVSLMDWRNSPGAAVVRDYLSVDAFVYYLPSALKASLEDPEFFLIGVECLLPMNKKREPKGEKWAEFSRALTDAQRACVVEFLKIGVEGQFADPSVPYESDIALRLWS
ncbi:hypothetical protein [Ralstonia chuxiongensis]|uniref:hypothetical protein n=1 Tax=Ralstonia chuxiongensis TaxID=2957504 RepID=UPI0028F55FD3|nr:hypothetical protein [Ralstonia chuxiongensis]CAJ0773663.1 hypothetical protein R8510_03698 [Ralstonia chuxiongensis]